MIKQKAKHYNFSKTLLAIFLLDIYKNVSSIEIADNEQVI